MESNTIITISRNQPLQLLRTQVLEQAGYSVIALGHDAQVMEFLTTDHHPVIGLVLMCHSVPEPSRITLCDELKKKYPVTPIIILYNGFDPTAAKVDGSLHNVNSPKSLLGMIGFLSGRRAGSED